MKKKKPVNKGGRPKKGYHEKTITIPVSGPNEDPLKIVRLSEVPDPEREGPMPDDEAARLEYPPPRRNALFRQKWMDLIETLRRRENFHVSQLNALEILCDLYVEYQELQKFVRINGRSYKTYGRQGLQWKFFPEYSQLGRVQAQIKEFHKLLHITPKREHGGEGGAGGESGEWE